MLAETCDGTFFCGIKAACEIKAVIELETRYLLTSHERDPRLGLPSPGSAEKNEKTICASIQASRLPVPITI